MKNYILYTAYVLVVMLIATATHAQQPTRDLSRFTGKAPLAPTGNAGTKAITATHARPPARDLNRFAGKAPLAPGSGNTVAKTTNITARKAATVSVNLPSASPATEKKQAAKTTALPAGPPAAVTEQENAKPVVAPKTKTLAKPTPVKS